ncbi:MAG: MATE family efflux transporter [Eubacteriales bacterium]|nr:MATE family efflux transporter [Eubacteriales bacterium]
MTNDMTVGNPTKLIVKFIIPLLIGNIFQQFYSMVDTIIVGRYVGIAALGGIGLTGSINFLILGFAMGLTSGFAIPIAQSFGANDYKRMRHYVMMSIYLCCIWSVGITIVSSLSLKQLLILMQTPEANFQYAYDYMIIILLGMFTNVAYNMTSGILRSLGDTKTPLIFLVISSALNIILDLVFILNFNMGVSGAAYATVISQGVSALLCIIFISKKFPILKIKKEDLPYSQKSANHLTKIGFPMAAQFSVIAVGSVLLQSSVNKLGEIAVAGYSVSCKVEQLAIQPFSTLGVAAATYTGQNFGAGKIDRIKDGMKKTVIIGIILSFICAGIIYFFGNPIINMFMSEGSDKIEVIKLSRQYLNWASCFFIPLMLLIVYRSAIQGLGDGVIPMFAGIVELVGRVSVAMLLAPVLGFLGVSLACPAAWSGAALLLAPAYFYKIKNLFLN